MEEQRENKQENTEKETNQKNSTTTSINQAIPSEKIESEQKPQKIERPKNCIVCNKSIKKLWYYREGNFFCGKKCWRKYKEKLNSEKDKNNKKAEEK